MLTPGQIDMISVYCENRGVVYYDVQLELVDHIADMIEKLQEENPQLSFDAALALAGTRFSKTEFDVIVSNKKDQLLSRFMRLWRKEFYAYFTVPKVTFTLALVAITAWLTRIDHIEKFPAFVIHIFNFINFSYTFGRGWTIKQVKNKRVKLLLVYKILDKRNILIILFSVFYLALSVGELSNLMRANRWIYEFALYLFPFFILISLAWRKTYVDQLILIKENYPNAFAS